MYFGKRNRGFSNTLLFIFGAIMLIIAGAFTANNTPMHFAAADSNTADTYFELMPRECGLVVGYPTKDNPATSPLRVRGYVNGCGWKVIDGMAGTVQVVNSKKQLISIKHDLPVVYHQALAPSFFDVFLPVPIPEDGQAILLFESTDRSNPMVKYVPIIFQ